MRLKNNLPSTADALKFLLTSCAEAVYLPISFCALMIPALKDAAVRPSKATMVRKFFFLTFCSLVKTYFSVEFPIITTNA